MGTKKNEATGAIVRTYLSAELMNIYQQPRRELSTYHRSIIADDKRTQRPLEDAAAGRCTD